MDSADFIITGLPRGGTTLLAAIMDEMPDSVCLNEPLWQHEWAKHNAHNAAGFADWLTADFSRLRALLAAGEPVMDMRSPDGKAVTNYFISGGASVVPMPFIRSGLSCQFLLSIKHNGLYLSALPALARSGQFKIIALIRSPQAVLAAWQKTLIPVSEGRFPAAKTYWRQMAELTSLPLELLEKQVRMIDLIFKRLWEMRDRITIVTYEELTADPNIISAITGKKTLFNTRDIQKKNPEDYAVDLSLIAEALKRYGRHYRHFYG